LDADMAEAAGPDDDRVGSWVQDGHGLFDGVVGGQPGVGERGDVLGSDARIEPDHGAGARLEELGEAAVGVDPGERPPHTMHVVTGAAGSAQPAGDQRVDDDDVADIDVVDGRPHGVDPAGVLVPQRVREVHVALGLPLAFDDVQIRSAHPGAADANNHVERPGDRRVGDLLDRRTLTVGVQSHSLHRRQSFWTGV
jgi:hypothetical protein